MFRKGLTKTCKKPLPNFIFKRQAKPVGLHVTARETATVSLFIFKPGFFFFSVTVCCWRETNPARQFPPKLEEHPLVFNQRPSLLMKKRVDVASCQQRALLCYFCASHSEHSEESAVLEGVKVSCWNIREWKCRAGTGRSEFSRLWTFKCLFLLFHQRAFSFQRKLTRIYEMSFTPNQQS